MPLCHFILMITISPALLSPVAYILQKPFEPVQLLTSSIILTENILLLPAFPFYTIPRSRTCAVAVPNLKYFSHKYLKKNCISIKNVEFSGWAAVVHLEKPIDFGFKVNTAMVPAVTSIVGPFAIKDHCKVVYHERDEMFGYVTTQKVESATIQERVKGTRKREMNGNGITGGTRVGNGTNTNQTTSVEIMVGAKLGAGRRYCVHDNGLPFYCESGVVGVFWYGNSSGCCVDECREMSEVKILKLYTEEVQDLLKKYLLKT